jgi:hypothetical protein
VTLIKVQEGEKLVQVARVAETMEEDSEEVAEQSMQQSTESSPEADTDEALTTTDAPEKE